MNNTNALITIIGAGSCGTAFAISIAKNGSDVVLWGRDPDHIASLQNKRCNTKFLPDIPFPDSLHLESDLTTAVSLSRNVLIAVPSYAFGEILQKIKPLIRKGIRVAWATKGLETKTGRFLQDVAYEILGKNVPLAVISGPTLAREIAEGLPTAVSLAATDENFSKDFQDLLHHRNNFQVYRNLDFVGVQLCGVLKNIIAIASGISDGVGFGTNARSILISQGLNEMLRFGMAVGAKAATFTSIAGLGDLVLSCTNNQSRNRRFGIMLAQEDMNVQIAKKKIGQLVEGYYNVKNVYKMARDIGIKMPISNEVYQVLFLGKNIHKAANAFFDRNI